MSYKPFRFSLQELGGALGDLGTLLPLSVALILANGLNATLLLGAVGLFYILSGLYYRIPMPVQPLKAVAIIAISLGLTSNVIGAAGIIMGAILLVLSLTNLISHVSRLFPKAVVKGIQLSVGLALLKKGIDFALGDRLFMSGASPSIITGDVPVGLLLSVAALMIFIIFRSPLFTNGKRFPAALAVLILGFGTGALVGDIPRLDRLGPGVPATVLPGAADFATAFIVLVIPQLPLTLGNAVAGTRDAATAYFKEDARRVTPRALAASMGLANVIAGLVGTMPMCHGSGGLTAHYKLGARTAGANLMIGGLLLAAGLVFGSAAPAVLSLMPLAILGVLLVIVGVHHACLIREITARDQLAVAAVVAIVAVLSGNLAIGFGAGILLHYGLKPSMRLFASVAAALWSHQ